MARDGISVIVPVGPQPEYKNYLRECLDSISEQMTQDDQTVLIDDQANLEPDLFPRSGGMEWSEYKSKHFYYKTPWLVGCADAWNFGVSLAKNDLCLLMGSDDRLYPDCLDELREAYAAHNYMDAWYNLTIEITEGLDKGIHDVFNNAAAVTRGLWAKTGGFGPSAFAAPDAWLISIMMVHMPERLIQVKQGTPLYWCRVHSAQQTPHMAGTFSSEIVSIRNKETERFVPPTWTKDGNF